MNPWGFLAQVDHFQGIRQAFSGPETAWTWTEVGLALLTVAAIGGILVLVRWLARRPWLQPYHSPKRLFRELCHAHRLLIWDRWFLHKMAVRLKTSPSRFFIDPAIYDEASALHHAAEQRLCRLRKRLLGPVGGSLPSA